MGGETEAGSRMLRGQMTKPGLDRRREGGGWMVGLWINNDAAEIDDVFDRS
jgi:hypothetical protein